MTELVGGPLGAVDAPTTAVVILVAVVAALLVPAGVAKLRDPAVARAALGIPSGAGDLAVRALGAGELVLAVAVLVVGGRLAAGVLAVVYGGFTVVAVRQRSRGESCGCFGVEADAPTSALHVALDAAAAVVATVAAIVGVPSLAALTVDGSGVTALPLLVGVVVATASAQLLLTALPDLAAARRASGGAT